MAAWNLPVGSADSISAFNIKLRRAGRALTTWSKCTVGCIRSQFDLVHELTIRLDAAQEERFLTAEETALRSALKSRHLGLAILVRIKQKQRARVRWLRATDASSKFFNIKANSRSKKNHIHSLRAADGSLVAQQSQIVDVVQEHFEGIMVVQFTATYLGMPLSLRSLKRKRRTVQGALASSAWLSDLTANFRDEMLDELIELSRRMQNVLLREGVRDEITWKLSTDEKYSA
ncbi:hypothetical protein D1007_55890 [Hordeum vulgare]|nr:hypothetical protein D1007_55890 [Hordeum vulgare]